MTLPIKLDSTSNGEYAPMPVGRTIERVNALAAQRITDNARRTGQHRRRFLAGLCGAATTLLTLNEAYASRGARGGSFALPPDAALDPQMAQAITGREFIFDIQTHFIEAGGTAWRRGNPEREAPGLDRLRAALGMAPKACPPGAGSSAAPKIWRSDVRTPAMSANTGRGSNAV